MNERAKYKLIGFIMMFCSSSLMGGIGAFTRFIDAPGDFVSFWRNFAGLIALTIIFLFIGGFKKVKATRFSGMMLLSGIFLGLLSGLYCLSTQYTTLANASFLIYTGPIYSTILAAIFLKEKIDWRGILCIIAVVVGMLMHRGHRHSRGSDARPRSHLYLRQRHRIRVGRRLMASTCSTPAIVRIATRTCAPGGTSCLRRWPFALLLWHNFCLQPLSYTERVNGVTQVDAAGQIITHPWNMFTMPLDSWLWLIAAALITGFGAFYLLTHATKRLKAGELAAISYQETIMASLLGLCLFGETMTAFQLIGGALIVIGGVSQIVFTTSAANKEVDDAAVDGEVALAAQVGAGGAGFIDANPDGMDPKLAAMADGAQKAADAYDRDHPDADDREVPCFRGGSGWGSESPALRLRTCQMGLFGREGPCFQGVTMKNSVFMEEMDAFTYREKLAKDAVVFIPCWCARTAWQPYGHVCGRRSYQGHGRRDR